MSSIVVAGDTSGSITLQAPGVAGSAVLTLPAVSGTVLTTATGQTLTAPVLGTPASGNLTNCTGVQYTGFKNRIINGNMAIDQRNAGASVSNTGGSLYYLDMWNTLGTTSAGVFSIQRVADAPSGFTYSAKMTVTTADASLVSTDRYVWIERIEGYNIADLAFGTASATNITVSFWVKSSLTGTFGGAINNANSTRTYPFNYTISVANTWEQKSITITGDTTGTWVTDNARAMQLSFSLGVGTDYQGTLNTWANGGFYSTSGATNILATVSNTWQVTGVQLEKGSTATSFDYRPYGTELALCQRYYYLHVYGDQQPIGSSVTYYASNQTNLYISLPVPMRSTPSLNMNVGSYYRFVSAGGGSDTFTTLTIDGTPSATLVDLYNNTEVSGTAGQSAITRTTSASAKIAFSAEL